MIEAIDHTNTIVLLIGSSDFPEDAEIDPIPNVLANLKYFKNCLTNPEIVGIPEANIIVSLNENRSQIEKRLRDIAGKTRNKKYTLLVYYTGHGILSADDFQLYLTTHYTSRKDLEIDGIDIKDFKKYIRKSIAGRKIVILDCCHSGAIIGSMGDLPSKIQSELNGFEGTYVMTSAAEDTPSLFPVESPEQPTYFTGKLVEVLNEGLDVDKEYCSLRDIYHKIEADLTQIGLPRPQQSNFNSADQLYFSLNKKFIYRKPPDELAWKEALQKDFKWAYVDFKNKFPQSPFVKQAKKRIYEIDEDECWNTANRKNTLSSLDDYLDNYPQGRYANEANKRIKELREKDEKLREEAELQEISLWNETKKNTISSLEEYLEIYPNGKFAEQAKNKIQSLKEIENTQKQEVKKKEAKQEAEQKEARQKEEQVEAEQKEARQKEEQEEAEQKEARQKEEQEEAEQKEARQKEEREEAEQKEARQKEEQEEAKQREAKRKAEQEEAKQKEAKLKAEQEEAKQKEARLKAEQEEERFWINNREKNTIESFEEYVNLYPSGMYIKEAKRSIKTLRDIEKKNKTSENLKIPKNFTKILVTVGVIITVITVLIVRNSGESSPANIINSDSTTSVKDNTARLGVFSKSLLNVTYDIPEDSLKYYKDYSELTNFRNSSGDVFNYKGGVSDKRPNGYGVSNYGGAWIYKGTYKNGLIDGKGTIVWSSGDRYEGEFKQNAKSGKGTYIWPNGAKYVGNYVKGQKNGYGEYFASVGEELRNCAGCTVYKGDWKNDKKSGYGKCYGKNGKLLYEGSFEDDKPVDKYPSK